MNKFDDPIYDSARAILAGETNPRKHIADKPEPEITQNQIDQRKPLLTKYVIRHYFVWPKDHTEEEV